MSPRAGAPSPASASPVERSAAEEWARSIVGALLLFFVIRVFVVQSYKIPSESMEETLLVGDYLMSSPALFGARIPLLDLRLPALREPRHGDVVVFRPEYNEPKIDVVKRLIGEPGDTIEMREQVVYRNGVALEEPYVRPNELPDEPIPAQGPGNYQWQKEALPDSVDVARYAPTRDNWGPLIVPPGHFLVLGDNRDESLDSRYVGFIPREVIIGKVLFLYYSIDPRAPGPFPVITGTRWERLAEGL